MKKINFYDLKILNKKYEKNLIDDFKKINKSGRYILGRYVESFEKKLANYCKAKYCIAVGNCLDAIRLSFMAFKILGYLKDGDEVLVPANTYIASIFGVTSVNLVPVFVEPDPKTFNISASIIKKNLRKKTKAILAVDLYGHPADLINIKKLAKKKKLLVVQDAAQSIGAKINNRPIGSISDTTCFSFFPGKNLGAIGDAGAVTTNDKKFYNVIKSLRNYGEDNFKDLKDRKYKNSFKGVNSRMDEIQGALLEKKLKDFDLHQKKRRQIANFYLKNINNPKLLLPFIGKKIVHAWHLFVIKSKFRDKLEKYLRAKNIPTMRHYPIPPHKQKAFRELNKKQFKITENIYNEILSLPIFPTLKKKDLSYIVKMINKF